jgi:hypothetical protein
MMQKLEEVLYAPEVRSFVITHPYAAWGLLALALSSLILVPVMLKWPKRGSQAK